jgi:hypothetical protein
MPPSSSPTTASPTLGGGFSSETALELLSSYTQRSMTEPMQGVDLGTLPPRIRQIYSEVWKPIAQGWKPIELARSLGVSPSFVSELLAELRAAAAFSAGMFPPVSDDEYRGLLESIAAVGIQAALVVDEHGVIDGYARLRALRELAHICALAEQLPDWESVAAEASVDREATIVRYGQEAHADWDHRDAEKHGRKVVQKAEYLASIGAELVAIALDRRWMHPPVDRREDLTPAQRRTLAITLNTPRRHLSRGELRLLIEVELTLDPTRSDPEIARLVGCTRQWVNMIRLELERGESQEQVEGATPCSWRPVVELACPSCSHHLALERAGREFRLELTAG